jgi:magnesium transporter
MVGKILQPEIKSLIDARNFGALREVFEWPPADVAEVILDVPEDEQVIIFRVLPFAGGRCFRIPRRCRQIASRDAHEQVGRSERMSPDDRTVAGYPALRRDS